MDHEIIINDMRIIIETPKELMSKMLFDYTDHTDEKGTKLLEEELRYISRYKMITIRDRRNSRIIMTKTEVDIKGELVTFIFPENKVKHLISDNKVLSVILHLFKNNLIVWLENSENINNISLNSRDMVNKGRHLYILPRKGKK